MASAIASFRRSLTIFRTHFSKNIRNFATDVGPEVSYKFTRGPPPGANVIEMDFDVEGGSLKGMEIAYETWGTLNSRKDNAILLHCGMSASSHAKSTDVNPEPGWWEKFIGPGLALDTDIFFVICANNLGSCFGSTGPSSVNPGTKKPYGSSFPTFTVQDQVRCQFALLDSLGIDVLHGSVGSSLGGMQSLCATSMFPDRIKNVISISACASTHPGGIAFRQMQRECIMADPDWKQGDYYESDPPLQGLRLARQAGTITYRSGPEWATRFGRARVTKDLAIGHNFEIEKYIRYQGEKWAKGGGFDPNSLIWMTTAMDAFTMERKNPKTGEVSLLEGFKPIQCPALVIGVQTDVLFPSWQQKEVADLLRDAGNTHVSYYELDSFYGHDTFLLDTISIGGAVKGHLEHEPCGAVLLQRELRCGPELQAELGCSPPEKEK
uniref:AB hydrolase-1 domain-containing protein n=1 Tax=Amorphochlora amoebiformis TaxID=1561963 RepID=A0A7S0DFA2_9EUKA|mmetsp:Transcript_25786/g.40816  ORF Transcript_25786/g.40816 Transcript_25786/m.40816 type:complete len:437 (+) Transcript_25786:17-1327(+)